jgi:coenzyme PQQ synthesis protein D (PqqD)
VLDTKRSEYLAVNGTGTALWPLLVAGATREELVLALFSKFGVSKGQALSDVSVFVASLAECGICCKKRSQGEFTNTHLSTGHRCAEQSGSSHALEGLPPTLTVANNERWLLPFPWPTP